MMASKLISQRPSDTENKNFGNRYKKSAPLRLRGRNSKALLTGDELYRAALAMDLQWFAAEDEGRTFEPTDATYRKAREEGRVAKSQELIAALGMLLPAIVIIFLAPWMLRTCAEMLRFYYTRITELDPTKDRLIAVVVMSYYVRLALPILIVGVAAGLFSNIVQVGFLFSSKPLTGDMQSFKSMIFFALFGSKSSSFRI